MGTGGQGGREPELGRDGPLRFDGREWYAMPSPTSKELRALGGTGPTDVYAVGEDGLILRFDGGAWRVLPGPAAGLLLGLVPAGRPGAFLAVGARGSIIRGER